jgi:hypothetical protein
MGPVAHRKYMTTDTWIRTIASVQPKPTNASNPQPQSSIALESLEPEAQSDELL